jgi:hypothetical protein
MRIEAAPAMMRRAVLDGLPGDAAQAALVACHVEVASNRNDYGR